MLKPGDLAARPDFAAGALSVSPSRRRVSGPAGEAQLEPLIMQLFLILLDSGGRVVTRNELFDQLWGSSAIGDDSLNRAIAGVRKIGSEVAPGFFEIETIPRTGYRLTGDILFFLNEKEVEGSSETTTPVSRRKLLGVGAASAAVAAGALGLWSIHSRSDRKFAELMARGEKALDYGDPADDSAHYFREAAALRPGDAKAHGLLAYSRILDIEYKPGGAAAAAVEEAGQAAHAALALDAKEPNARLAQILLQRTTLDLAENEDRLRAILATDPTNIRVMRQLWSLLQCVGRSRDSLGVIQRATAVKPLAASTNYPRAQLLWILGRDAEADRVIDRAMQYWPQHRFVRFARFTILAFTGRADAALAMLESPDTAPQVYSPEAIELWRLSLPAIGRPSSANAAAVRRANLEAGKKDARLASQAVMTLSALGDADGAFEIVDSLFVVRRAVKSATPDAKPPVKSTAWRFAPWLFVPPTKLLRADARFDSLCDTIGLTEYWMKRGIRPDYQLGIY